MNISSFKTEGLFRYEYERGIVKITKGLGDYYEFCFSFCKIDKLVEELTELKDKVNELFPQIEEVDEGEIPFSDKPEGEEDEL